MVLGHLGLNVPDLGQAKQYYGDKMPLLGYEAFFATEDGAAFMPAGGKHGAYLFLYPAINPADYSRHRPGPQHLAFVVPTRSHMKQVHDRALELGCEIIGSPQEFPQYPGPYFATF